MVTQRRYSVTGQTPPDDAEALKAGSPKLHALDTAVQTGCGLCESSGAEATKAALGESATASATATATTQLRGRKMSPTCTITRTSSKRSATQLPSPSSPTCELPPKIARYRLSYNEPGMDMDTDTDSDVTDAVRGGNKDEEDWNVNGHSQPTSVPSTPEFALPMSALYLPPDTEDEGIDVEDLALSPPHSRNHSLNCASQLDTKALQRDWAVFKQASALLESQINLLERMGAPAGPLLQQPLSPLPQQPQPQAPQQTNTTCPSPTLTPNPPPKTTFLTLPPEIRHAIYRLDTDLVKPYPLCYCLENAGSKIQHPFASVSRQIRAEALSIFYSHNVWAIKTEYKMFYEAFRDWIIRLGPEGAGRLRLVRLSVRGKLFKPRALGEARRVAAMVGGNGQVVVVHTGAVAQQQQQQAQWATTGAPVIPGVLPSPTTSPSPSTAEGLYSPPDGEACFTIDLSEKYPGGLVRLMRNDGSPEAGEKGRAHLEMLVLSVWQKRREGRLNGQDWIALVDGFLGFVGMVGGMW
ncbi:hypothetical protein E8E13_009988 [Curvularia kusanoi]|uniref:Uncharacterized protein n=1 Tax=Curvularia kusanoi TaxID=90978 RepID=A0A9P4TFP5_CURKU|nr:hypothetical protein E8E13_009988 [Curvularia kusanoi]